MVCLQYLLGCCVVLVQFKPGFSSCSSLVPLQHSQINFHALSASDQVLSCSSWLESCLGWPQCLSPSLWSYLLSLHLKVCSFPGQYFHSCLQIFNCIFSPVAFPAGCLGSLAWIFVLPFCSSDSSICSSSLASLDGFIECLRPSPLWHPELLFPPTISEVFRLKGIL